MRKRRLRNEVEVDSGGLVRVPSSSWREEFAHSILQLLLSAPTNLNLNGRVFPVPWPFLLLPEGLAFSRKDAARLSQREPSCLAKITCVSRKDDLWIWQRGTCCLSPNSKHPLQGSRRALARAEDRAAAGDPVPFVLGWRDIAV